jgi:WD40 repeat protein
MPKNIRSVSLLKGSALAFCLSLSVVAAAQAPTLKASLYRRIAGHSQVLRQVAFSPDAQLLATSSVDSTVKLWRVSDGKLARTIKRPEGVTAIAFSPDGQWLGRSSTLCVDTLATCGPLRSVPTARWSEAEASTTLRPFRRRLVGRVEFRWKVACHGRGG